MALGDVIDTVERREKTLTVFNPEGTIVDDLSAFLTDRNVEVVPEETASGRPSGVGVLTLDEDLLAAVGTDDLRELLTTVAPGDDGLGVDSTAHRELLQHLNERTFTSYDTRQMYHASKEIEDRAWRVGAGTIHAGFQTVSAIHEQRETYVTLAERGVDVYIYATPDGDNPQMADVTIELTEATEIEDTWFVVFDGGEEPENSCALVAEERAEDAYYGVWTYDTDLVDRILAHLDEQYSKIRR